MSKKILVCDDTMFMRKLLREILVDNGYEVIGEAENGIAAIEKYNLLKPDLILMDITMPEMDGIAALNKIIEIDSKAKVIICSAMGQEQTVLSAIKGGAKDFIVKPFDNERVIQAVAKVVGS